MLDTKVETFLRGRFERSPLPSVILTGNAGDGKTYLCRQVAQAFSRQPLTDWEHFTRAALVRGNDRLHVVKDLSELSEQQGIKVLQHLNAIQQSSDSNENYLIAANEGRLRHLLSKIDGDLPQKIDQQLANHSSATDERLIVINLTEVTTSSFVPETLDWMTDERHWEACQTCSAQAHCPLFYNANRLREPLIRERVQLLYKLLEHLDVHVTVRDMLIHLAYTVTGGLDCQAVQQLPPNHNHLPMRVYYENIWGRDDDPVFRRKASVLQHLEQLQISKHSHFEIDDFIVSGGHTDAERALYEQLFAEQIDLNKRQFAQDRDKYLSGGADLQGDAQPKLLDWLPHCRRKLFFEWNDNRITRLIPFLYLDLYRQVLEDLDQHHDRVLKLLVLGLNRAFSRLYLTEDDYLYVTTQYLHSGEQPRPLVRLRFPIDNLWLDVSERPDAPYDYNRRTLYLEIEPPARQRRVLDSIKWPLGLLQFEYLVRLAHGGTYNILAEECELEVRSLKDQLLSQFAQDQSSAKRLEFFVAEQHRYTLKSLSIDGNNKIRG